jgi:hypothetical protein
VQFETVFDGEVEVIDGSLEFIMWNKIPGDIHSRRWPASDPPTRTASEKAREISVLKAVKDRWFRVYEHVLSEFMATKGCPPRD